MQRACFFCESFPDSIRHARGTQQTSMEGLTHLKPTNLTGDHLVWATWSVGGVAMGAGMVTVCEPVSWTPTHQGYYTASVQPRPVLSHVWHGPSHQGQVEHSTLGGTCVTVQLPTHPPPYPRGPHPMLSPSLPQGVFTENTRHLMTYVQIHIWPKTGRDAKARGKTENEKNEHLICH